MQNELKLDNFLFQSPAQWRERPFEDIWVHVSPDIVFGSRRVSWKHNPPAHFNSVEVRIKMDPPYEDLVVTAWSRKRKWAEYQGRQNMMARLEEWTKEQREKATKNDS